MMKEKNNAGFSLIEVIVAMAILASVVVPVCSGMLVSVRVNAKAEALLRAKLAVSSAVETLRAKGYSEELKADLESGEILIIAEQGDESYYYNVEVTDTEGLVTVSTIIRAVPEDPADGEAGENQ